MPKKKTTSQKSSSKSSKSYANRRNSPDFTGGRTLALPKKKGSTGSKSIDQKVADLVAEFGCGDRADLVEEMVITSLMMGKDELLTTGDHKLYNRALKENRDSSLMFGPYADHRKVSMFGSARTKPHEPEYQTAVEFGRKMAEHGYMGITGAGPGIMGAAQAGSGRENSFGLSINLPFEAGANETIEGDHKLYDYNYFFTRKLAFVKESDATAAFPGGFGTMDELFEVLTLIQTGKATIYPITLIDAPGGTYWKTWQQFIQEHLFRLGLISETDFGLYMITDDVDEAVEHILNFYSNFHSYRYVGKECVIRVQKPIDERMLIIIDHEFRDLLAGGDFEICDALPQEADEPELKDLYRLKFKNVPGMAGRFRKLIDKINEF